jgi:predicted nucleotidyltransferase
MLREVVVMGVSNFMLNAGDLQQEMDRIKDAIVQECKPEKIIVFGSLASGQIGQYSDIDIAVIMDTDMRFIDRLLHLARITNPQVGVDFLVYTPSEFNDLLVQGNLFIKEEIAGKGRVIYERVQ